MSREGKIALGVSIMTGALYLLLDPNEPIWRLLLLASVEVGLIIVLKECDWLTSSYSNFNFVRGEIETQSPSNMWFTLCVCLSMCLVVLLGIGTWPTVQQTNQVAKNAVTITEPPRVVEMPKLSNASVKVPLPVKPKPIPKPQQQKQDVNNPQIRLNISEQSFGFSEDVLKFGQQRQSVEDTLAPIDPNLPTDKGNKPWVRWNVHHSQTKDYFQRRFGYRCRNLIQTLTINPQEDLTEEVRTLHAYCDGLPQYPQDAEALKRLSSLLSLMAQKTSKPPVEHH